MVGFGPRTDCVLDVGVAVEGAEGVSVVFAAVVDDDVVVVVWPWATSVRTISRSSWAYFWWDMVVRNLEKIFRALFTILGFSWPPDEDVAAPAAAAEEEEVLGPPLEELSGEEVVAAPPEAPVVSLEDWD